MWVRAQVDLLQRLPSDLEKHRALKRLPPTLPLTYVRIFETIHGMYPSQTTRCIQRLLRWLVLGLVGSPKPWSRPGREATLKLSMLCKAISVEINGDLPLDAAIPPPERLFGWLGCLVRRSGSGEMILSHFTVGEFLSMNPEDVSSLAARKYLVCPKDVNDILKTCLTYVMHENFKTKTYSNMGEINIMLAKDYWLEYIAITIIHYVRMYTDETLDDQCQSLIREFLSVPPHKSFELLDVCSLWLSCSDRRAVLGSERIKRNLPSPLHFAALAALPKEVERILDSKIASDGLDHSAKNEAVPTPLHLAICVTYSVDMAFDVGIAILPIYYSGDSSRNKKEMAREERSLQVIKALVDFGADVDRKLLVKLRDRTDSYKDMDALVTPLTLAIICRSWRAASALLAAGATWEAVADADSLIRYDEDLCSIESC